MCEPSEKFSKALEEQGLDAKVTKESSENTHTFYATKEIGNSTITLTTSIDVNYTGTYSDEKRIAIAARGVADKFKVKLTEKISCNGRNFQVKLFNDAEARCLNCGSSTKISSYSSMFEQSAEISLPQPKPVEQKTVIESLNSHSRVLLKLYLLGKLSTECECSNDRKI